MSDRTKRIAEWLEGLFWIFALCSLILVIVGFGLGWWLQ